MSVNTGAVCWPTLVPEDPIQAGPLAVYPLLSSVDRPAEPAYLLLEQAIKADLVHVTEVSDGGHVPTIALVNHGTLPVLAIQGQELVGAKQNRTLNVSILAPRGRTEIPVTCVERGRWGYRSAHFAAGTFEHLNLRKMKAEMVYAAAKRAPSKEHRFAVNQSAVWAEVDLESARHGVRSSTAALNDVYSASPVVAGLQDFDKLRNLPQGTVGVVVAMGGKLAAAEFLETPEAFAALWPSILKGYSLSALRMDDKQPPARMEAQMFVAMPSGTAPSLDESVGLGRDARWEGHEFLASALVHEDRVVHGTLFARG